MKRVVLAVAVLLCTASLARAAGPIEGCYQKKSGALRVLIPPDTCRKSEVKIQLGAPAAAAEGFVVRVYDAAGQYLGISQADSLYIPSLKKYATIDLTYFLGDLWHSYLYYESADCTGQPYGYLQDQNWVTSSHGKYYTVGEVASGPLVFQSYWEELGGACQGMGVLYPYGFVMGKAVEVTLPFTTPVALPVVLENSTTPFDVRPIVR